MRPIWIATAVFAATIALTSCKNRKQEPVPGPQSGQPPAAAAQAPPGSANPADTQASDEGMHPDGAKRSHGASGIYWFQGTIEEAFSTTCGNCTARLWHEALDRR
jgi:hypothetical protein